MMSYAEKVWVGPAFEKDRIFVLGESWYGEFSDELVTDDGYIRAYLDGRITDRMYSRIANACGIDKRVFWEGVMFTNFVIQCVGAVRACRPTADHYRNAVPRLARLLAEHKPAAVWILGKEQARHSGPVVAAAGIPFEITDHPTSYGVPNEVLRDGWRSVLAKAMLGCWARQPQQAPTSVPGSDAHAERRCLPPASRPTNHELTHTPRWEDSSESKEQTMRAVRVFTKFHGNLPGFYGWEGRRVFDSVGICTSIPVSMESMKDVSIIQIVIEGQCWEGEVVCVAQSDHDGYSLVGYRRAYPVEGNSERSRGPGYVRYVDLDRRSEPLTGLARREAEDRLAAYAVEEAVRAKSLPPGAGAA